MFETVISNKLSKVLKEANLTGTASLRSEVNFFFPPLKYLLKLYYITDSLVMSISCLQVFSRSTSPFFYKTFSFKIIKTKLNKNVMNSGEMPVSSPPVSLNYHVMDGSPAPEPVVCNIDSLLDCLQRQPAPSEWPFLGSDWACVDWMVTPQPDTLTQVKVRLHCRKLHWFQMLICSVRSRNKTKLAVKLLSKFCQI